MIILSRDNTMPRLKWKRVSLLYKEIFLSKFRILDTEQEMMDTYGAFAPSESEVASYKEKLDNSKAEQKNLFLIIFQVQLFRRLLLKIKLQSEKSLEVWFTYNHAFD